jgi:hypothetical protein
MLNELRGRNLAHVGCTLGLTGGLLFGLIGAILVLHLIVGDSALTVATILWLGLTFGLGALGYFLGGRSSRRLDDADVPRR